MKILFYFILVFFPLASLPLGKDFKWLLIDFKPNNGLAYIDLNNSTSGIVNDSQINITILLNVLDRQEVKHSIKIFSIVTVLATNCDTGVSTPIKDVYFGTKLPTQDSEVVGSYDYDADEFEENHIVLDKKSTLYRSLCPLTI